MPRCFLDEVAQRVVVSDGAMGTMLYAHGMFINRSYDELNLSAPAVVKEIHQAYAHAGAEILETNTFGANAVALEKYGLRDRVAASISSRWASSASPRPAPSSASRPKRSPPPASTCSCSKPSAR
jgi:methionine synthase I (cobalamin-dependent)